jgi:hypothetical protein
VGNVRAYNNLLARLAATCINIQKGLRTVLFVASVASRRRGVGSGRKRPRQMSSL